MRKFRSSMILLLVFILAVSLAAVGCGKDTPDDGTTTTTTTKATTTGTEKATAELEILLPNFGGDLEGTIVQEAWLEAVEEITDTVIDFSWILIPWGEYEDKVNISLAANDFPDMLYTANWEQTVPYTDQGMFVELSSQLDKISNYLNIVDQTANGRDAIVDGEGKIYGFRNIEKPTYPAEGAAIGVVSGYRYDKFEEHDIKIPETTDEFYQAAKKLKELYPDSYPINGLTWASHVPYAFHVVDDNIYWYGDEFDYGVDTENFKDSLIYLNKLYSEGLLDPEHWTNTRDQRDQKAFNDVTFMFLGEWNSRPTEYTNNEQSDSVWVTTYYPSNPKYGEAWQGIGNANEHILGQHMMVVNSATDYPDLCVQLADLEYSDEITQLLTWGVEGETYEVVDGAKTYVSAIKDADNPWLTANEYGIRISANQRPALQLALDGAAWTEMASDSILYINGEVEWAVWEKAHNDIMWPDDPRIPPWNFTPPVQFTPEESEEIANIMTPVKTYVEEMKFKFIKGEKSFDEWDDYLEGLKKMGDYEKVVKMYNDKVK